MKRAENNVIFLALVQFGLPTPESSANLLVCQCTSSLLCLAINLSLGVCDSAPTQHNTVWRDSTLTTRDYAPLYSQSSDFAVSRPNHFLLPFYFDDILRVTRDSGLPWHSALEHTVPSWSPSLSEGIKSMLYRQFCRFIRNSCCEKWHAGKPSSRKASSERLPNDRPISPLRLLHYRSSSSSS